AVTLAVTILVSAFVSLTLTPMMSAKLLKSHVGAGAPIRPAALSAAAGEQKTPAPVRAPGPTRFYEWSVRIFARVIRYYGPTLKWILQHQTATLLVTAATLVLTIALYVIVPKGFFPLEDPGVILGISDAPQNISFTAMSTRQQQLAQVILKD